MNIETEPPFTSKQWNGLTVEQRHTVEAIALKLYGESLTTKPLTDESITEALNLLKPTNGCVPAEEINGDVTKAIRNKFNAIFTTAMEQAVAELTKRGQPRCDCMLVVDASYEDATHVVIVDCDKPIVYLHEWSKAWHFTFASLNSLVEEVERIKQLLITTATPKDIFVVVEDGRVRELVDLPDRINVTIVDYDVEDAEPERLQISPLDGEACFLTTF